MNLDFLFLCLLVVGTEVICGFLPLKKWQKIHYLFAGKMILFLILSYGIIEYVQKNIMDVQKEKLLGYAPSYAIVFEKHNHENINSETKADDPQYLELITYEKDWLKANPFISDIYTMKKDSSGKIRLIVDSETDYNMNGAFDTEQEQRTPIGELFTKEIPELNKAFEGTAGFTTIPYTDRWGTWVSAFVPLYTKDRKMDAVLGIDFNSTAYLDEIQKYRWLATSALAAFFIFVVTVIFYSQKLSRRNEELKVALVEANLAATAKAKFLANMSHEIRTPMNAVLGMTQLLSEMPLTAEASRYVRLIRSSSDTLLSIINDILDFSKIEKNKINVDRKPFNLFTATEEVVLLLQPRAHERGLALQITMDPQLPRHVIGDGTRFRQLLMNLVGNAIKFTQEGTILINAKKLQIQSESSKLDVQFSIKDNGIGISPEAQSKLFLPFSQVDASTTKKFGGTGLGLAICKGICEAMDGRIWVESELGKGSTFYFTLQLKISDQQTVQPSTQPKINNQLAKTHPLRILIAEDNMINQQLTLKYLEKMGYTADVAFNGLEVLDLVGIKSYDLILMDSHMPEMDGIEATKRIIQRLSPQHRPRIVALTASVLEEDRKKCMEAGMDDFLTKPLSIEQLQAALLQSPAGKSVSAISGQEDVTSQTVVDEAQLKIHFQDMESILIQTLEVFIQKSPLTLQQIALALKAEDRKNIYFYTHTLKGSTSHFQTPWLMNCCKDLEKSVENGSLDELKLKYQDIETAFKSTHQQLSKILGTLKANLSQAS